MQSVRSVRKDYKAHLARVNVESGKNLAPVEVRVVRDFMDVFLEDLPSLLLKREVKFSIDHLLGTASILKTLYYVASVELKKLKTQLQGILDKVSFDQVFLLEAC